MPRPLPFLMAISGGFACCALTRPDVVDRAQAGGHICTPCAVVMCSAVLVQHLEQAALLLLVPGWATAQSCIVVMCSAGHLGQPALPPCGPGTSRGEADGTATHCCHALNRSCSAPGPCMPPITPAVQSAAHAGGTRHGQICAPFA